MQTSARITKKQLSAQMQKAVEQYLLNNTVKRVAQKQVRNKRSLQCITQHIGKNCVSRAGARV